MTDETSDESWGDSSAETGCDDCGPAFEDCEHSIELTAEPVATLPAGRRC